MGKLIVKYLIDSNIVIYHLKGEETATGFLDTNKSECAISLITYLEVMSYEFNEEQFSVVKDFMNSFMAVDIDRKVINQALENRKKRKIKIPDNLIVSSAQVNSLVLVTRNIDDFKAMDVEILNIFNDE